MKGKKGISPKQLKRLRRQMLSRSITRSRMMGSKNTLATAQGVNSKNLKKVIQQAAAQKKKSWVDRTTKGTTFFQKSSSLSSKRKNPTNVKRLRKISNYLEKRDNRPSKKTKQSPNKPQKKQARKPVLKGYQTRQQFAKMQQSRNSKIQSKFSKARQGNRQKMNILKNNSSSKGLAKFKKQMMKQPIPKSRTKRTKVIVKGR